MSLPKESLGKLVTDFFKTFKKLLILEGTFDISEVFRCASWSGFGDHIVVCFRSTLVVFIFV